MALSADHPLLDAAAELIDGLPARPLQDAYERLSQRYRAGDAAVRLTEQDVHAYLAARLAATLAATTRVLDEVVGLRPDWRPTSSLDVGSGPGTATWAAASAFPSLERLRLVESNPVMARVSGQLAALSHVAAVRDAEIVLGDAALVDGPAELVLCSYLLGELGATDRARSVDRMWAATTDCLVITESGTPSGYATVIEARERLISTGARILAPCPHEHPCPLSDGDWCHFSARVPRTATHRTVKRAERGFEDEKFSYLVALRGEPTRASRVLRRPLKRSGYVKLTVCRPDGVGEEEYSRRQGPVYTAASRLDWGDRAPSR